MHDADSIDLLGEQLARFSRVRERTTAQIMAASKGEIELASYSILFKLIHDGPMRSGALADLMLADASTISRHVAALVKKGLIARQADPDDGRAIVLVVTDAGRELTAELRRKRNAMLGRVVGDWTPDDRSQFARLLTRFVDGYESARIDMVAEAAKGMSPHLCSRPDGEQEQHHATEKQS
ncbi:MarR family winged helix-turn-helix transcriptional regulator [Nocardia stercoris]|uniref:MarR family transcriptional regulator n=1 Tax=Nocardia stercoris TaxID=2483361 RepID=A0A3M2LC87_9NOCA|nr:MarR family transcriptional regulator [Nocardia stercoris]RMI35137.1 MarR family transcriptional regulator [Nocardia stercoris]